MSVVLAVKKSLSAKVTLTLAALLVLLMALAALAIITAQSRQLEEATLQKARITATLAARQYGDAFDAAIDSGLLTVADVFDTAYVEIKGWNWGGKPKFHTRYDAFTDRAMTVFQDKVLENQEEFIYAVGLDVNGYVPTHNIPNQRPLEGNEKDLLGNRTKRLYYSNPTEVNRAKNLEPFLLQVYHRDTGETLWDASAPIWVKGKHWGAFVLGVSMRKIEAHKRELILQLTGLFLVFAALISGAVYVMVRRSMRPVVALTAAAEQISLGEGLDTPIQSESLDEIGMLTRAIERLRVSMRAAMSRLGA